MTERQIQRFFRILAREFPHPARIIVTGAAAGSLFGSVRPSLDIDFGVTLVRGRGGTWGEMETAIAKTVQLTGIPANYAQDIDRWGQMRLADYRHHTLLYRTFGMLDVRLLEPAYWSIGKISRYLDPDIHDVVAVLTRTRLPPGRLIRVWTKAWRASPPSTARAQFYRQAEHFLQTYGRTIWGRRFEAEATIRQFHRSHRSPK